MNKVVYVSLDERPCNYDFPVQIFDSENFTIERVPKELLGYKKKPANIDGIHEWLERAVKDAYGLVISLDTLAYGGIIPSRLHLESLETLTDRINFLCKIKEANPNLKIYAFQLIMRCSGYNSSDEELDYYEQYGRMIFQYGYLQQLIELNEATDEQKILFEKIDIPKDYLDDYRNRRVINRAINVFTLSLVEEGIIDFLVIPQDDSAPYGWTAWDQEIIREKIEEKRLQTKVYMYPGADEVGMTLMARMYTTFKKFRPKLVIKYPAISAGQIIPNIEDRYLDTTVRYHITVCGGIVVNSLEEADGVVFINAPADRMLSRLTPSKPTRGLTTLRNMPEAMEYLEYALREKHKAIIIGDITYGNGSSLEMYDYLSQKNMLFEIAAYGGWNTASNAIGGAIAQGVSFIIKGKTKQHMDFLMHRYIEDIAYCGYVRQYIRNHVMPIDKRFTYYDVKEERGIFSELLKKELMKFINEKMPEIASQVEIKDLYLPWKRMYEIGLKVKYWGSN